MEAVSGNNSKENLLVVSNHIMVKILCVVLLMPVTFIDLETHQHSLLETSRKIPGLLKKFKLIDTISTSNMRLLDHNGTIKKYDTPERVSLLYHHFIDRIHNVSPPSPRLLTLCPSLEKFFHLRLDYYYEKRKKSLLDNLEKELLKLDNKIRLILCIVEGKIVVNNRKRADLFLELEHKGFIPFPKEFTTKDASDYEYLLAIGIERLTYEKVQHLFSKERDNLLNEIDSLRKTSSKDLWNKDLEALELQLDRDIALSDSEDDIPSNSDDDMSSDSKNFISSDSEISADGSESMMSEDDK